VGNDGKNYIISGGAFVEGNGNTRYYTDAAGRTLYLFTNDAKDTNTFTNGDAGHDANWPIFHVEVGHLPSALNEADFGEIEVNGASQLTYKGWPLYYFGGDANKGDTKGVSVPTPGKWPIINENTAEAELP
jgi:predicted lipoprotein with Yx(FWY)xxD motif